MHFYFLQSLVSNSNKILNYQAMLFLIHHMTIDKLITYFSKSRVFMIQNNKETKIINIEEQEEDLEEEAKWTRRKIL